MDHSLHMGQEHRSSWWKYCVCLTHPFTPSPPLTNFLACLLSDVFGSENGLTVFGSLSPPPVPDAAKKSCDEPCVAYTSTSLIMRACTDKVISGLVTAEDNLAAEDFPPRVRNDQSRGPDKRCSYRQLSLHIRLCEYNIWALDRKSHHLWFVKN